MRQAGDTDDSVVFMFSDTQIKDETFIEDINSILNAGEVPNIFETDELVEIRETARSNALQQYGKEKTGDWGSLELYDYFISRIKQNLHVVLCFSPVGDAFRERLRKFPSLVSCCTIDVFQQWPADALGGVAQRFLERIEMDADIKVHHF